MIIDLGKAPAKGYLIGYYEDGVYFGKYVIEEGAIHFDREPDRSIEEMTQCHFYDARKEYRCILVESRGEQIQIVLTAEEEEGRPEQLLYRQKQLLKPEYGSREGYPSYVSVISRYKYSPYDTLVMENYRISSE